MRVAIVRGKYLNSFEMQNYAPLKERFELTAFASLTPIHESVGFPVKKLSSPMDVPDFPYKLPLLNRLMVDAMYLVGLERALEGFDLVCACETYFHFTQQALNAKKQGRVKKVLVTCSETIPHNHEGIWGRKRFKDRVIREADHFHCLTEKAKRCLIEEGANPKKISVIGYGIDLKRFSPPFKRIPRCQDNSTSQVEGLEGSVKWFKPLYHRKKNRGPRGIKVLFVGRLVEEKGVGELLAILPRLHQDFRDLRLTIIGKGPMERKIRSSSMIRIIELVKGLPYSKMPEVYQSADIFVLPSKPIQHWEEYYGMVLLEAMASGLPVVTTDCGAIPEVVSKAALVVSHSRPQPLYQALKRFVASKKLRERYGQKAYRHARTNFDCQKQAKQLGKLFQELLG